jgi:hypothetical protein
LEATNRNPPEIFLTNCGFKLHILRHYTFWLVGVRPAILMMLPYNYRVRMSSARGIYLMEVREYRNFIAWRL